MLACRLTENLDRKSLIRALGYDFDCLVVRVLGLFDLAFDELLTGGKQQSLVQARSVLCYWGTRELGMSAVSKLNKLNIASSTASESAMRGRQIVEVHGLKLLEEDKSGNPRNVIFSPNPASHFYRPLLRSSGSSSPSSAYPETRRCGRRRTGGQDWLP